MAQVNIQEPIRLPDLHEKPARTLPSFLIRLRGICAVNEHLKPYWLGYRREEAIARGCIANAKEWLELPGALVRGDGVEEIEADDNPAATHHFIALQEAIKQAVGPAEWNIFLNQAGDPTDVRKMIEWIRNRYRVPTVQEHADMMQTITKPLQREVDAAKHFTTFVRTHKEMEGCGVAPSTPSLKLFLQTTVMGFPKVYQLVHEIVNEDPDNFDFNAASSKCISVLQRHVDTLEHFRSVEGLAAIPSYKEVVVNSVTFQKSLPTRQRQESDRRSSGGSPHRAPASPRGYRKRSRPDSEESTRSEHTASSDGRDQKGSRATYERRDRSPYHPKDRHYRSRSPVRPSEDRYQGRQQQKRNGYGRNGPSYNRK